jgi:RNA recognition motif. (a.k.a. RRM, RBD, or RNP domain)
VHLQPLNAGITSADLSASLGHFGSVTHCRVVTDARGGAKCFGVACLEPPAAAQAAIKQGTIQVGSMASPARVREYRNAPRPTALQPPHSPRQLRASSPFHRDHRYSRSVYVANLPDSIQSDDDLRQLFTTFGPIESIALKQVSICSFACHYRLLNCINAPVATFLVLLLPLLPRHPASHLLCSRRTVDATTALSTMRPCGPQIRRAMRCMASRSRTASCVSTSHKVFLHMLAAGGAAALPVSPRVAATALAARPRLLPSCQYSCRSLQRRRLLSQPLRHFHTAHIMHHPHPRLNSRP